LGFPTDVCLTRISGFPRKPDLLPKAHPPFFFSFLIVFFMEIQHRPHELGHRTTAILGTATARQALPHQIPFSTPSLSSVRGYTHGLRPGRDSSHHLDPRSPSSTTLSAWCHPWRCVRSTICCNISGVVLQGSGINVGKDRRPPPGERWYAGLLLLIYFLYNYWCFVLKLLL
jgi:hypothetical protein